MLRLSSNNRTKVLKTLKQISPEEFVVLDRVSRFYGYLEYMLALDEPPKRLFFLTETLPDCGNLNVENVSEKPWAYKELISFCTIKSGFEGRGHNPLYEKDVSRLSEWQAQYMMGPLRRVYDFVHVRVKSVCLLKFFSFLCQLLGLFLQLICPYLRPKKGVVHASKSGVEITILSNGAPTRDHYGETSTSAELLKTLSDLSANIKNAVFFLAIGPKHKIIHKLIDIPNGNIKAIFATGIYRTEPKRIVGDLNVGKFYAGDDNLDQMMKNIYSEHCLEIGAGENEIWIYRKEE
ncbi:MAG: hypothetical protein CMH26_05005 [Micavibrio sp.]|nr:hypothetical protein [Micavibrio sp.]|tara:strand:- start:457 stop:1332 length:876 start_codon:yes stop_codon:yes gene_type:complete